QEAKDTADGKRRTFVVTPFTPYDAGDLWAQGSGGHLMRCIFGRQSGAYVAADWVLATKYTDDTVANQAASDAATAATAAATAQTQANISKGLLADLANYNRITPSEKQSVKKECDIIVAERPVVIAQAATDSVSTTAYTKA